MLLEQSLTNVFCVERYIVCMYTCAYFILISEAIAMCVIIMIALVENFKENKP